MICPICNGKGWYEVVEMATCPHCHGTGVENGMVIDIPINLCPQCGGKKKVPKIERRRCKKCGGHGQI